MWIALRDLAGSTDTAALPGFWHDACKLAQHDGGLASSSHLIGHCLRELDSLLRALMLTPVGEGSAESEPTDHGEGGAVVEPDAEVRRENARIVEAAL